MSNITNNLRKSNVEYELLLVQKRTNKKPKAGDVFVLNPKAGLYCFGKVILTKVESRDSFVNGMDLVFIYDYFSETDHLPNDIECCDILMAEVINHQLWIKGFAKNIAHTDVTEKEMYEDFAFWDIIREEYVDIKGNPIHRIPKTKGIYGLGSYGHIGRVLHEVIEQRGL